jgi:hypothetical protein
MQQDREIEDREPLDQRERQPNQRVIEPNQGPGGKGENRKLPGCHDPVPPREFLVQLAHQVARNRGAKLSAERTGVLGVMT